MSLKPTSTTGQISGIVRDQTGIPVPAATVVVSRTFPITGVAGPRSFTTVTDSHGCYSVPNLPVGSYKVCPSAAGAQMLDPCLWTVKHPFWNVQGGQSATVNVALDKGQYVYVRVDDPGAKLPAAETATNGAPAVRVFVTGTHGTPLQLDEASRDPQGRNYWVLVPKGQDIPLQFDPGNLTVQRSDG